MGFSKYEMKGKEIKRKINLLYLVKEARYIKGKVSSFELYSRYLLSLFSFSQDNQKQCPEVEMEKCPLSALPSPGMQVVVDDMTKLVFLSINLMPTVS